MPERKMVFVCFQHLYEADKTRANQEKRRKYNPWDFMAIVCGSTLQFKRTKHEQDWSENFSIKALMGISAEQP